MLPSNKEIVKFLSAALIEANFVDRIKIKYRPLICPVKELLRYSRGAKSVFDIGCGSGQFVALLANYTRVDKLKGIEISNDLISNARQVNHQFLKTKQITFALFNGKQIPDDIVEYDLVYIIDVFHHIPKVRQRQFITDVFNKMKKGAKLVFKDIDKASPLVLFNKMHDLVFSKEIGNEISLYNAEIMLKEIGFNIIETVKTTTFFYPHYFVLAQKDEK
jgi:2-polyprenyl-3-methyl-5-hydroxy-6-metoxy-1,4-benzoquinol methylase